MTGRTDPLPMGSSPDNAERDQGRAVREAKLELDRQLAAGEITQVDYDSMLSVLA
jgi:hypothetical protein